MIINSTVAVIIVNWKKYDITSSCIGSILNSTNSNLKIILVDNESDNKKVKNFKYRNEIEIIQNKKNEGFSKANNIGIEYAQTNNADYIFLLNQDAKVEENTISDLVNVLEKNKDFGEKFIKLSRDVHFLNDDRAKIKLEINNHTGSVIKEIKEYTSY